MNKIIDIDRAREIQDQRLYDAYCPATGPDQHLHEWLKDMGRAEFDEDCADFLLCYMPKSGEQLQEWLAEASEQQCEYPNERSAIFVRRACDIVEALLASADKYQQVTS